MSGVSGVAAELAQPTILAIDTSTERLGVAVLHGEAYAYRHLQLGTGHANQVLVLVEELLQDSGVARAAVDAIAVCRGPGGFTGLRIAIGVAQGLALALDRPVVPVSGLRVLAAAATETTIDAGAGKSTSPGAVVAVIDARMGEFYVAAWESATAALTGVAPWLPESLLKPEALMAQLVRSTEETFTGQFVGPGVTALAASVAGFGSAVEPAWPDARLVAWLGRQGLLAGEGVPAEMAQPVYLRDQVAVPSVGRVA